MNETVEILRARQHSCGPSIIPCFLSPISCLLT